jgi:hypothetical protein
VRSGLPSLEIQSPVPGVLRPKLGLPGRGQGVEIGPRRRSRRRTLGVVSCLGLVGPLALEELGQVGLGGEPGDVALHGGVGLDLGSVEEQLLAPHQPGLYTLLHNPLEEAAEGGETVSLADAGEGGVVGQRFVEIVAQVPPQREAV